MRLRTASDSLWDQRDFRQIHDQPLQIRQSLRGVLRNFGLRLGPVSKLRYEARIRELVAGNSALETASAAILRVRAVLRSELSALERQVLALTRHDYAWRRSLSRADGPVGN